MTPRPRVITVSVAVCTLLVIASAAVGLSTLGASPDDAGRINNPDFAGVSGPANATPISEDTLLNRSALPEREPDNRTYRSIVIFRDDDVQSGYRPKAMQAVNNVFVDEKVPVTLAVIPRVGDGNISDTGTCSYLVRLKRAHPKLFELSLHGYSHANLTGYHGASEFGGLPAGEQAARIARGKAIMQQCTGLTPQTFVPPFNTYDANTTAALRAHGINTISAGAWFSNEYYNRNESGPFVARGVVHVPSTQPFIRNWTTDKFFSQNRLQNRFDQAYQDRSVYVQVFHYASFNTTEKRDRLHGLIRYMKGHKGVKFMTVAEFSRAVRDGTLTRTPSGWRYSNATANSSSINRNASTIPTEGKQLSNETTATTAASSALPTMNQTVETNRRVDS